VNALTVFVLAGVLGRLAVDIKLTTGEGQRVALKTLLYGKLFAPFASPDTVPFLGFVASPRNASLLWAVMFVALLYAIAWFMHRRGWILKV
jgi:predicted acyltransferase